MTTPCSHSFTHAVTRTPANSVTSGLRAVDRGAQVTVLDPLEAFPDSVFVEDAALCLAGTAIALRPGAPTRRGETAVLRPTLETMLGEVLELSGEGFVDGGDVLVTEDEVLVGLSARTDLAGFDALAAVVTDLGYRARKVDTPPEVLHFKTECGLLDPQTIFASARLAATGCFANYRVLPAPDGEEAASNLIRFNDTVFINEGFPRTRELLDAEGYKVVALATSEAARVDAGLSCMSLRFSPG